MLQLTLSILTVLVVVGYGIVLSLRKCRGFAVIAQIGGLAICVVLEIGDLGVLIDPEYLAAWKQTALVAEVCLPVAWLFFVLTFARQWSWRELHLGKKLLVWFSLLLPIVATIPVELLYYAPDIAAEKLLYLSEWGYILYVTIMVLLVVNLFFLEQTLISLSSQDRRQIKLEIVGAGVILAVLIIYYSQALLYRSIDMNLTPVRSLSLLVGVGLMIFSRLRRGDITPHLRISRSIVYRSMVILAMGFYLVCIGSFGAGMSYFHIDGNRTVLISLAVGLGLFLVFVILSEHTQRRLRVLLHKNFYQQKYDYRQEWLNFTSVLEEAKSREDLTHNILSFFVDTFYLHGASLFLLDEESGRYFCSACLEKEFTKLSLSDKHPYISRMQDSDWVVDMVDQEQMSSDCDWSQLRHVGCSFLVPLRFEKRLEGFIALGRRKHEEKLTYEDFDLMRTMAYQTTGVLLSRKFYADLAATYKMAAIGRVSTFVIHDLKNLVSGLGMVVDNSREYIDDPEFRADMFETLENTVINMKGLISRLQNVKQTPHLQLATIDLLATANAAAATSGNSNVLISGTAVQVRGDDSELEKVLLNLLHNAREASPTGREILVEVGCTDMAFVQVSDWGQGMSADFISYRLFEPFETTKKAGVGIGLYQCRQILKEHGGRIDVQSVVGVGTTFTIWLPLLHNGKEEVDQ